ncbi:OprD family outer membrane porin [Pseudomonas bijieensis]|uniref:OprD family porin n=1 Tax=Pseudomonas bijieensis TaxID=2681983 RepID=A0A6N1CHW1_9PSED|nr:MULTISPECIES: OprD family outer membrane porin [Pseudomonas]AXP05911.1 outer membrane porin, OprD family [Pseudomonas fluorescens]MCD9114095.1 OprD family porin [Pseudomonas bijieensis]QIB06131.1 OprD family porin [Pseudomonas fluorescens]QKS84042.1 OprD family porin [Pseudomonas bijieensis]BBH36090.1 protein OprD [Pseudomonas sp. St290]
MKKSTLALAVAVGVLAQQAGAAGFIEDSKASVSSRTLYFDNDNREGGNDQRETATGLKFDYKSGFTQGVVGFGIDAQALVGIHLDGGKGHHPDNNSFVPSDSDGSAVHNWSRLSGNVKALFSKTEAHLGGALAPNLPILVASDGRLLPQTFEGGTITSKDLDNVTFNAGQLEHAVGRAGSNSTGLAVAGGTEDSNQFRYAGADWKVTKDLTLQYYYANLQDYYKQHFLGAVHVFPISEGQSFKTDLRYFDSSSDGRNGDAGYRFNNNGGYAKNPGEVDNKTWSAMFTYTLGGSAFLLGHQQVGDDGGFVYLNQGSLLNDAGRNEGAGGSSFYLFTDSMINAFVRAGENTTFGQYSYDFTALGAPGLKASIAYLHGDDIKSATGGSDSSEWERDMRLDYVVQQGPLKGFGTTLRHGTYRGSSTGIADQDQTRLIFNYTYNFM